MDQPPPRNFASSSFDSPTNRPLISWGYSVLGDSRGMSVSIFTFKEVEPRLTVTSYSYIVCSIRLSTLVRAFYHIRQGRMERGKKEFGAEILLRIGRKSL